MLFSLTLTGTRPVIMHNARLVDPLNPYTRALKEITDKRKMTIDDHHEKAVREWRGGLYWHESCGPYIPAENIERMLVDSAKITRDGMNIKRGVQVLADELDDRFPLQYEGPRDIQSLERNENYRFMAPIRTPSGRVMRCRPMFREWSVVATGHLDEFVLSPEDFTAIIMRAGRMIGLGDWRPRYGRFTAKVSFTPDTA